VKFLIRSIAFKTQVSWNRLKMVEATDGGIEDLDIETRFFLVNCISYLTRSAWNKLKAAEVTGGGIEDLDVETRLFLENCLSYFTCVRSRESKLSLSNTRKREFGLSSINFNQIIVRLTVLLLLCTIDQFTNNGIQLGYRQTPLTDKSEALFTRVEALVSSRDEKFKTLSN
jgi:hypothetical protein